MDRTGESTRIFAGHIKQYIASLPLFTVTVMVASWIVTLVDVTGRLYHGVIVSEYLSFNVNEIFYHGQAHRLLLYPFGSLGFSISLTNTVLVLPYLARMERKYGTVQLAWVLFSLITFLPVVILGLLISVGSLFYPAAEALAYSFAGLSAWTVGLAMWSAMDEQAEGQSNDRMLFGVLRIPGRHVPLSIIGFYLLLMPDRSVFVHLTTMSCTIAYVNKTIPARYVPSTDTYRSYEDRPWLQRVVNHSRFISVDNTSGYLPIANSSSQHLASSDTNSGSSSPFPGQGQRLGDD